MRAAMVGGGAYVAGKHVARGQQRESEQEERLESLEAQQQAPAAAAPPPAPAAPAAPQVDVVEEITKLKGLLDAGALTQEEFDAQKRKVLGS